MGRQVRDVCGCEGLCCCTDKQGVARASLHHIHIELCASCAVRPSICCTKAMDS